MKRLSIRRGRLVLEGSMGAWPARVEMEPADLLHMARLVPLRAIVVAGIALLGLIGRSSRKPR
ncbi:MAG TPA: hypothetical protein VET65_12865 [Candidatus Limnocylindrales bacterium]|nr:hypothetical protein [Candidatus Limnocylindrales bacterium]